LDIFEMIVSTSEPMINWLIESSWFLKDFKWILRKSNAIYIGGKNMGLCSPLLVFLLGKH
jgi:hypothetical protein